MCCVPYHMQTARNCFLQKTFTTSSLCITYRSYGKLWSTINKINNQERDLICIDFQFLLSAYGVVRFIQFFIIIVSPDRAAALRFSFLCFLFCWDFCCKRAMQCHSSRDRRVRLLHILRIPISVQTAFTCELKWAKAGRSALFCWKRKFNEKSNTLFYFCCSGFSLSVYDNFAGTSLLDHCITCFTFCLPSEQPGCVNFFVGSFVVILL